MRPFTHPKAVLLAGLLALSAGPAPAAIVIDQNQPVADAGFSGYSFLFFPYRTQSFRQSANNIAGAGVLLRGANDNNVNVTLGIWDGKPGDAASNLLASGSGLPTGVDNTNDQAWFDVFWTPVALTPGTTYYLDVDATNSGELALKTNSYDPYPDGNIFSSAFAPQTQYDYVFRTYADTTFNQVAIDDPISRDVPEPEGFTILSAGLGWFAVLRRRYR